MITIIISTRKLDELENFYRNIMGFLEDDDGFFFPGTDESSNVRLCMQHDRSDGNNLSKGNVFFRFSVEKDFLSYCKELMNQGVGFEVIGSHPGGYAARAYDLEDNKFEIECDNFDEKSSSIDPFEWACYKRY